MRAESTSPRHWAWIGGWGVAPDDFAAVVQKHWPADRHTVLAPTENAVDEAVNCRPDILAGYSLGSLLLLANSLIPADIYTIGIAPILAFDQEAGLAGKTTARTRLAVQNKLTQNPVSAVKLYLRLVGLGDLSGPNLPYSTEDLAWGLEALGDLRARPENHNRTDLYVGAEDPLTDIQILSGYCPHLEIINGCGHDFRHLIPNIPHRI